MNKTIENNMKRSDKLKQKETLTILALQFSTDCYLVLEKILRYVKIEKGGGYNAKDANEKLQKVSELLKKVKKNETDYKEAIAELQNI